MGNVLILGPNRADAGYYTPTFSTDYGQWLSDYPLTNLQSPYSAKEAWSLNLSNDATQFVVDLGTSRSLKGFAIPWGNFLVDDTVSVYVYTDSALSDLAGSIENSEVYREVYPLDSVLWEDAEFWDGKMTAEDRDQFPVPWFDIFDEPVIGQYVHVQINATDEGSGSTARTRLKLGRLIAAEGYQPTDNAAVGSSITFEDATIRTTALGGSDFFDGREKRRIITLEFPVIEEDEAMANMLDSAWALGRSGQVFVAWNSDDTLHRSRRSMLATVEKVEPFVAMAQGRFNTTWQFREAL